MFLQPPRIPPQLLLDSVGRAVEGHLRFLGVMRGLQDYSLGYRRYDVACEIVVRATAERNIGPNGAGEMLFGDFRHAIGGMFAQGFTRIDLMARNRNVHLRSSF
jgi:hypothetical protein